MLRQRFFLTLLIVAFTSAASASADPIPWERLTKICYTYNAPSVPNDERRDYTIIIDANNVWLSVRCGNQLLIERRYDNTPSKFRKTIKALRSQKLEKTEEGGTRTRGCSSEQIVLYAGDKCVLSAYREGDYGNLYLKHGSADAAFKAAVPESVDNIILETFFYPKKSQ